MAGVSVNDLTVGRLVGLDSLVLVRNFLVLATSERQAEQEDNENGSSDLRDKVQHWMVLDIINDIAILLEGGLAHITAAMVIVNTGKDILNVIWMVL